MNSQQPLSHPGLPMRQAALNATQQISAAALTAQPQPQAAPAAGTTAPKKRRVIERHLPPSVSIPESRIYTRLLAAEHRLDALLARKRLQLTAAIARPNYSKRTARIYISNLYSAPVVEDAGDGRGLCVTEPGSWTLRIEGRLLHDTHQGKKSVKRPFVSLLRSLVIEITDPLAADGAPATHLVEWHRSASAQQPAQFITTLAADGFETRGVVSPVHPPSVSIPACVYIRFASTTEDGTGAAGDTSGLHERWRVRKELADVIGLEEGRRVDVAKAVWVYAKQHGLLSSSDTASSTATGDQKTTATTMGRRIQCNATLKSLFHADTILLPKLPELLQPYLVQPHPIRIEYPIRIDKEYSQAAHAYDVDCWIPDPITLIHGGSVSAATGVNEAASHLVRDLTAAEDKLTRTIRQFRHAAAKRDFLNDFANDPAGVCNKWVASQARDLTEVIGEPHVNIEARRRGEYYQAEWVNEAVLHHVQSRS